MPLVIANEGKVEMLGYTLTDLTIPDALYNMFLFVNNYTPVANMTIASFTKPAWGGYEDHTLLRSLWQVGEIVEGKGKSLYNTVPEEWLLSGGSVTVYGYGIQSTVTESMLWAERFETPRTLAGPDTLKIQPQFTDDTDPDPL